LLGIVAIAGALLFGDNYRLRAENKEWKKVFWELAQRKGARNGNREEQRQEADVQQTIAEAVLD
jgi:hypothetical protein